MDSWRTIKVLKSDDPSRRVKILQSPCDQLFKYYVNTWFPPSEMTEGVWDDSYWSDDEVSGLFERVEDCEREARQSVPFLRTMQTWKTILIQVEPRP
jgi:hypothetical protein